VLAGGGDHVFVDCGPVGLAGRGGHGHNDCLSFEATIDGVKLVSDAGSYVYTASPAWRNRFRGTAFHNTPEVDGRELNRISASLWLLADDARPTVETFEELSDMVRLRARHTGYLRLPDPVTVRRTIGLVRHRHVLIVHDELDGLQPHRFEVPLLLAPGVDVTPAGDGNLLLASGGRRFTLSWRGSAGWSCELGEGWVSPSYGVKVSVPRLLWRGEAPGAWLTVTIAPDELSNGMLTAIRRSVLGT
jgi:Heparinase II/III-like protein